jgi:hypothetical protein
MRRWSIATLAVATFFLSAATKQANAGPTSPTFSITISDLDLTVGGDGFIDVKIASGDGKTPQALALAN